MSGNKNDLLFFNFSDDFLWNFDKLREGDPVINELKILFDNNDKILQVRLTTNIASEILKKLKQRLSQLLSHSQIFLGLNIDVNINSNSKTVNFRNMMDMLHNLDDLRKHNDFLHNSFDDSFLNLYFFVGIVNLLNNSLSSHMNFLILNWSSYFNFRVNLLDNFVGNELLDFISNFFDLFAANFNLNWHLLDNFNLFNLLDDISLHSFLSDRHINWNFLIVKKMNKFWHFNQLRSDNDLVDRYFDKLFMNLVDNLFLF